jgi:hypothetical protein
LVLFFVLVFLRREKQTRKETPAEKKPGAKKPEWDKSMPVKGREVAGRLEPSHSIRSPNLEAFSESGW